jgi:glutamyl/glutaminyl-tRNA synthetase
VTLPSLTGSPHVYRGRLAPSPTGLLHLGHARTFWTAAQRAAKHHGQLIFRNEDLDSQRCRPEFVQAMIEELRWLGIEWVEGLDCGGPVGPYAQSERRAHYLLAWRTLRDRGMIYPCTCSRKDVAQAAGAPNDLDDEPVYPGKCRPQGEQQQSLALPGRVKVPAPRETCGDSRPSTGSGQALGCPATAKPSGTLDPAGVNWRFQVPDGEEIRFTDLHRGPQHMIAGQDFGDFIVWRRDDVPAYQLAVVVDDAAMRITEVVRGADLLKSTARQLLLFRALELAAPDYFHCDLVRDETGMRLAKRHDSLSIRKLRELGWSPEQVRTAEFP